MRRALAPAVVLAILAIAILGGAGIYATSTGLGGPATATTSAEPSAQVSAGSSLSTSAAQAATSTTTQTAAGPSATTTQITNFTGTTTMATTIVTSTVSYTATQFMSPGVGDVVQSCAARGNPDQSVSCVLPSPVSAGHLMLVEVAEVPTYINVFPYNSSVRPVGTLSDSLGDNFTLIASAGQNGSTYLLDFYTTSIDSSAVDNVTLTGVGNYPFLLVHELQNVDRVVAFSTGMGNSTSPYVSAYTAPAGSFVLAGVFVLNDRGVMAASVTAGPGNALLDTTYGIADEYNGAGGPTISPFAMTGMIPWGEVSITLS